MIEIVNMNMIWLVVLIGSLEECIDFKDSQCHADAEDKPVECEVGHLASGRVLVAG